MLHEAFTMQMMQMQHSTAGRGTTAGEGAAEFAKGL